MTNMETTLFSAFAGLKGVVFDCDGVLLDSRKANIAFYNYIRAGINLPFLTVEQENYVHMSTFEQALDYIVPENLRKLIPDILNHMENDLDYYSLLSLENGLLPLLNWLKTNSIHMALCTNRTDPLEKMLSKFNLTGYFTPVQTASNSIPKPHPDGLLQILKKWSFDPFEVAFLGDSEVDENAARAADIHFWSFKNQNLHADLLIPDFATLHNWLLDFTKQIK
jgi:phosphoglycolate phosphatase-like HAD superfamily hydrolase